MNIPRKYLLILGWAMVLLVITLSLIPLSGSLPNVKGGDKVGHFIAYFSITLWFCLLYRKNWVKNFYSVSFIIMGGALEFLQQMTGYRSFDVDDFHMNTIGVIAGFVISAFLIQHPWIKNTFLPKEETS